MPPRQVLFQATINPHLKGQITVHSLQTQTWEKFQPITITLLIPSQQEQQQLQKAHIALPIQPLQHLALPFGQQMPHHHSCWDTPTGIVTLHLEHATSPSDVTQATIPWTIAGLTLVTHHTAWRPQPTKKVKPHPRPLTPHKIHQSKPSSSRAPHHIPPQIQTMTLILYTTRVLPQ